MLREIVVDAEGVALGVAEVLAHRAARVGGEVLERRRLGRGGDDHGGVGHRAVVFQDLHDLSDRGLLLAHRHVEAVHALPLLIQDRVDADGGLAGAAVADDELALAAPDGDHGVDGLEPGLERLLHRAAVHHAGRVALDRPGLLGVDGTLAVHRLAEGIDDTTDQGLAHRHLGDALGPGDGIAFLDLGVVAQEHRAHVVGLEVEHEAEDAAGELEQLAGERLLEPVDAGDAVADLDHAPGFLEVDLGLEALELALDDLADLFRLDHVLSPCEALAHARELPVETAVQDEAAHLGDEPAQERSVHGLRDEDLLAEGAAEPRGELLLLVGGEGHRRPHLGAYAAELVVHERAVGGDQLGEMVHAAAGGDEADRLLHASRRTRRAWRLPRPPPGARPA